MDQRAPARALKGKGCDMVSTGNIRGILSIAVAATLLSLAPRESFAQG
jgi:hypothetical protein